MLLRRYYEKPEGWEPQKNTRDASGVLRDPAKEEGVLLNPLPIKELSVVHTGVDIHQNFSRGFVDAGIAEGWLTLSRGVIILHTREEDLHYTIAQMPGRYCLHCKASWPGDTTGAEARQHIAMVHHDVQTPDPQWPHGYSAITGYMCILDATQHERYASPADSTVAHYRKKASASVVKEMSHDNTAA